MGDGRLVCVGFVAGGEVLRESHYDYFYYY